MFLDYDPDDIDVKIAELLIATSDSADPVLHPQVRQVLSILRERLRMDVAFVSQFMNHRRTFKVVDNGPGKTLVVAGQSDPLEDTWCQHVVDGRVPQLIKDARTCVAAGALPPPRQEIGTYLSTPVVLKNGSVYGTLCCFATAVHDDVSERDLKRLQVTAKLLARNLQDAEVAGEMELEPVVPAGPSARASERMAHPPVAAPSTVRQGSSPTAGTKRGP
jgi:hypothetical protein